MKDPYIRPGGESTGSMLGSEQSPTASWKPPAKGRAEAVLSQRKTSPPDVSKGYLFTIYLQLLALQCLDPPKKP